MMKPWHSVAVPHRDIREGRFDESVFAASLSDVVAGRGPLDYRDAATFFQKTYPTQGLVNLLTAVVGRLAGTGRGEPVIQVQTPFGGGKTHALVALYHLFQSAQDLADTDVVQQVLEQSGARAVPQARVVTFDGTVADPLGRTPWGELAAQLGRYEVLREHDSRRRSPGKNLLHALLADAPTLILMDEIAEYAVKARDFQDQVMAFFQELSETVKVAKQCALVVTLPSSAPYGEEGERALDQLQRIFGRLEAIYTPVEGAEVFEVIRRRLFEDVGDPREAQRVAETYWQMYQRLGDDVPAEARDPAYRERMRLAYPFHPQVIDILYERWSTFHTFQRTRGALRLLANVVADLYRRKHPAPLIQAAHLNLANPDIRTEFLKHIGNVYAGVIASDIVDANAKAQRMDREMGSEYARFEVASGLATAIFFGSFSGGERRGVTVPSLRLALLHEDIPPAIVGDALQRLEDELWFLHVESGLYQFRSQPNLNRVILEREEGVGEDDVAEEIRERLERMAGREMRVFLFPAAPGDIPDGRDLKLAILGGGHPGGAQATTHFAEELLARAGTAFRAYRNTLLLLAPDAGEFGALQRQVKRLLALRSIQRDRALLQTFSDEDKQALQGKLKDAEGTLDFQLLSAYRHLARASGDGVQWLDLGLPTTGERGPLAKRVREFLKSQDLLLDRLAPRHVLEKALGPEEQEKPLSEVYEAFLRYPHLPLLESEEVLQQAVAQGVRDGVFGVRSGGRISFREPPGEYVGQLEAVLVRPEVAKKEKGLSPEPEEPEEKERSQEQRETGVPPEVVHRLSLRVSIPWDQMSDFIRGVLMPLRSDEAELRVEIRVDAHSPTGIKKSTLEQKVWETLQQIGAEVLEYQKG
ncbi:MAG: ATP-binding protein [Anaerolineae bacterium]